ncbi:MAG: hypothetical protein ACREOE_05560, partial [Gemmatimonadales bacterium]
GPQALDVPARRGPTSVLRPGAHLANVPGGQLPEPCTEAISEEITAGRAVAGGPGVPLSPGGRRW